MKKIIFLMSVIWICSCSSLAPKKASQAFNQKEVWDRLWKNQALKRVQTRMIQAKIQLSLLENGKSLSGSGMFLSNLGTLRIEVRDPIGRVQYSAGVGSKKKFVAYYPSKNVAYYDFLEGQAYLRKFLKLEMNFIELKDLWLGILPFQEPSVQWISMESGAEEGTVEILLKKGIEPISLSVNPETGDVLKLKWNRSELRSEFEFSEFARCCEEHVTQTELPQIGRSVFLKNNQGTELELEWTDIVGVEKTDLKSFNLEIPSTVKKVDLN